MEYDSETPFANRHGPGLRMIVDLATPATARFLIAPGQSSNPLSPHYSDLALRWRDFVWLTLGSTPMVAVTHLLPATANRGN